MFMPLCMHLYASCIHGDMACGYLGMCLCVYVFTNVPSIMLNILRIIYVCHV